MKIKDRNCEFGLVMAGGMWTLALLRFAWTGSVLWWVIGTGAIFLALGLLVPAWLSPLRAGWMRLAAALGFVNSRILLTVVFALLITPVAVLLRVLGKRPIQLGRKEGAETYWHPRRADEFAPKRMERQF